MVASDTVPFTQNSGSMTVTTSGGARVHLRHINADDDQLLVELYQRMSIESRRLRFMTVPHEVPDELLWREAHRLSDLNPLLAAALLGTVTEADGEQHAVAVCRLARDADDDASAEMAIVVRDDYHGQGLGATMLDLLIQVAMVAGVRRMRAVSFAENTALHRLVQRTGLPVQTTTLRGETTQIITLA